MSGTGFNFRIGIRLFVDETAIFIFKTNDDSLLSFFLSSLFFIFILFFSLYNQISRSLSCFEIVFCNCAYSLVDRVHILGNLVRNIRTGHKKRTRDSSSVILTAVRISAFYATYMTNEIT